jgi:hypothetical protein
MVLISTANTESVTLRTEWLDEAGARGLVLKKVG